MYAIGKCKSLKVINKKLSFKVNPEAPTDFSGKQLSTADIWKSMKYVCSFYSV